MKVFRDYNPAQPLLLPVDMNEWLPKRHLAHFVNDVVSALSLKAILDSYQELRGYPPYDPRMMVRVWVYAMMNGIHSSRKIEAALHNDVGFRFLSGNQQPDHWTISEFRRRHHKALGGLFEQTVVLADTARLIKLQQVAIDGTKIKANASKHRAMSYGRMKTEEKRIKAEIAEFLHKAEETDAREDEELVDDLGWETPEELRTAEQKLAVIQAYKAAMEKQAKEGLEGDQQKRREKAEHEGKTYEPRKDPESAVPRDKDQKNFTDPDSRIMLSSDKAFIQGYNAQATVDTENHIIVAADLSNQANDSVHLQEQVQQVERNLGRRPKEVSADAGYYTAANEEFLEEQQIEAFIPPKKIKHSEWRGQQSLKGRIPKNATKRYRMMRKLRTKRGRARYKLRQGTVEPVFGFIKEGLRLRQFLLRGVEKAGSMWKFACAAHNLWKIFRTGAQYSPVG